MIPRNLLIKDKKHLKAVASLGCCICGKPAVAHHKTGGGMALKSSDYDTFPLCVMHHTGGGLGVAIHAGVETWEKKNGTQDYWIKWTEKRLECDIF